MLTPGEPAPKFTAKDQTGNTVSLEDFRGKTLVLWFFPKADTPGCTAEGCAFRDLSAEYQKKNAAIVGVSFDNAKDNQAFAQKFHFNFPLLCDTDRALGLAYGAADAPTDEHARRIGVIIGPDGAVKEWFPKVSAQSFPHEALGKV